MDVLFVNKDGFKNWLGFAYLSVKGRLSLKETWGFLAVVDVPDGAWQIFLISPSAFRGVPCDSVVPFLNDFDVLIPGGNKINKI